jgi:uncharacterized protein YndB with AHSA1/START domain
MTDSTITQVYRVYIKASTQAVWDGITDPKWNDKYGYQAVSEYDLRAGGAYRVLASEEMKSHGGPEVIIDGEVLESNPPTKLVQTWRALFTPEIAAEGFTRLTWELEEELPGLTKLTLTHELDNAPLTAQQTAGDIPNAGGGWSFILSDLKTLLETGSSLAG